MLSIILILSLVGNAALLATTINREYRERKKRHEILPVKPVSDIVRQIANSLESDPGWEFIPKKPNYTSAWINKKLDISLTTDSDYPGPRVYKSFDHQFNASELEEIKASIARRNISTFLSKRIDILNAAETSAYKDADLTTMEEISEPEPAPISVPVKIVAKPIKRKRATR
jgi:hypothetical protein